MWRVWIEILIDALKCTEKESPSVWRVWIEILLIIVNFDQVYRVTLRVEGVD